ncbi:hypothetical protein [Rathayibacter rathayi]|uniref:Uncharacterized protein n=1 Tax=Rathayibacter rathayi TaxID=33887 RepID=A0ABD6W9P6_RATRA|nr:hypothetical protein [Rathayibacter rathayi]AZZ50143.1 hypothetical protein C1O28_13880 [Rathayibacter rathayi]MWV74573.1 hypothetical protein [Rathayibacter rathayi NCPPB 2980 = VKM Ac-1601]PPF14584.1 hypothetical protein C5C04_06410 [Rathayibacter rathayi]PPF21803.1 hypothetical protein C5C34_12480 [Rathayibacter rathayi]PPF49709.1 hypothetical protein C5C08_06565 [Rathayibacter rathayi]
MVSGATLTLLSGAFGYAPSAMADESLAPSTYEVSVTSKSPGRLDVSLRLGSDIRLEDKNGIATFEQKSTGKEIALPSALQVSAGKKVAGEWTIVDSTHVTFDVTSVDALKTGGYQILSDDDTWAGCVLEHTRDGAIGGLAGIVAGPEGAGLGFAFGGILGSAAGAIDC